MVTFLPQTTKKQSFSDRLGGALSTGIGLLSEHLMQKQAEQEQQNRMNEENRRIYDLTGFDISGIADPVQRQKLSELAAKSKFQRESYSDQLKGKKDLQERKYELESDLKNKMFDKKQQFLDQLFQGSGLASENVSSKSKVNPTGQSSNTQQSIEGNFDPSILSDEYIAKATAIDPNLGRALGHAKDVSLREKREVKENARKEFESERNYQSSYSKEAEKQANLLRESIPKKANALNFARNSIESGDLGYFSLDRLADITGQDLFRTAKGAQLVTASKENLLSNMSRVSSRGQNMWFEQRLNSMFPRIGQSKEANLTVQEMIEGELALDDAYLKAFDRISEQDQQDFGYVRKDVERRARDSIKPIEKDIFKRTTYRMRELEEQEKGLKELNKSVGKNVSKGTPMTLAMAKLYKDKFGDKALEVAKKNGYYIPTIEEFKRFREEPQEFRDLNNE